MAVIAVFNQKGGVGKTTTTLNLAAALALAQKKPCAIDLDPQAHLTLSCGVKNVGGEASIFAFFDRQKPLAELLQETPPGIGLIPSSLDLSKIDALHSGDANVAMRLKTGLQQSWPENAAPLLIDCCPVLGVLTLNALLAAERVLIPVSADYLSLQGVHRLDSALTVLETRLKRKFLRRVVVTRFDARRRLSFEIYDRLKAHFGAQICETRISENVSLAESPAQGKNIFAYAPHSPGARDYRVLAEELIAGGFFD